MDDTYRMKKQAHRLTNKDFARMTGNCPTCGPDTPMNQDGLCANAKKERYARRKRGEVVARPNIDGQGRIYRSEAGDFRLPHEVIVEMKRGQVCAICSTNEDLVIDHCHKTGVIRGILCQAHNKMLGFAKDDVQLLQNAIAYLQRA